MNKWLMWRELKRQQEQKRKDAIVDKLSMPDPTEKLLLKRLKSPTTKLSGDKQ